MQPYYQDESVTIYHADCREVLPTLTGIDAVISDPPYNSGGQFRGDRVRPTSKKYQQTEVVPRSKMGEFSGDTMDQRAFTTFLSWLLSDCRKASKPSATCALFTDWRQLPAVSDAMQMAGWMWRGIGVWDKGDGTRPNLPGYTNRSEFWVWGTNGVAQTDYSPNTPGVIKHPPLYEGKDDKWHMAQKPIDVMRHIIKVVRPGGIILDPFMGSGTTLRAAKDLGRRAVGIEIEERYCEIAATRLQQAVLPLSIAD